MNTANTTVILMRHGHVDREQDSLIYGPNARLNQRGRDEMPKLADDMRDINFDLIHTSTTTRAVESTYLLLESLKQKKSPVVKYNRQLRSVNCPSWVGKPIKDAVDENGFFISVDRDAGDETFEEYGERIWTTFQDILTANQGRTIGIMGHSEGIGLIMHMLHHPEDPQLRIEDAVPTGTALRLEINPHSQKLESESPIPETSHRGIEQTHRPIMERK